jgi:hypothetical protein
MAVSRVHEITLNRSSCPKSASWKAFLDNHLSELHQLTFSQCPQRHSVCCTALSCCVTIDVVLFISTLRFRQLRSGYVANCQRPFPLKKHVIRLKASRSLAHLSSPSNLFPRTQWKHVGASSEASKRVFATRVGPAAVSKRKLLTCVGVHDRGRKRLFGKARRWALRYRRGYFINVVLFLGCVERPPYSNTGLRMIQNLCETCQHRKEIALGTGSRFLLC